MQTPLNRCKPLISNLKKAPVCLRLTSVCEKINLFRIVSLRICLHFSLCSYVISFKIVHLLFPCIQTLSEYSSSPLKRLRSWCSEHKRCHFQNACPLSSSQGPYWSGCAGAHCLAAVKEKV